MYILRKLFNFLSFLLEKLGYKLLISKITSNISYELIDKNSWEPFIDKNNYFIKIYNDAINKSKSAHSNSLLKQLRFYSLFNIVENIVKDGNYENFIECGCWNGHSSYAISTILKNNSFNKNFYIFDSFEGGLSKKKDEDINLNRYIQNETEILNQKNYFISSHSEFQKLMNEFTFVKIYKGWIPKVFENINNIKASFIHIDLDLYQPTYDAIDFLYNSLEEGGIIVCDDYNCSDFPGAKLAIDEFMKKNLYKMFYEIPLGGCIIIK